MFISVKHLTSNIDDAIQYYIEGMASRTCHTVDEFNEWHTKIVEQLIARLAKLKQISSNSRLISKYENKINSVFEKYEVVDK